MNWNTMIFCQDDDAFENGLCAMSFSLFGPQDSIEVSYDMVHKLLVLLYPVIAW